MATMKPRKTIELEKVREKANHFFKHSDNNMVEERYSIYHFVASLHMDNNSYKGFRYLTEDEVPSGNTFGIERKENNEKTFHDESRIHFY